jgi:hypothetical protein
MSKTVTVPIKVKNIRFSLVRSVHPNRVTLEDGSIAYRSEKVIVPQFGEIVCAPYDNHFVFLDPHKPKRKERYWFAMCSCGGPAVIGGVSSYRQFGSPQGLMLVCYFHSSTGRHGDGST